MISLPCLFIGFAIGLGCGILGMVAYRILQQPPTLPPKPGLIPVRGNAKRRAHYRKAKAQGASDAITGA